MPEPTLFPIDPVGAKPTPEPAVQPVAEAPVPPAKPPRRPRRPAARADAAPAATTVPGALPAEPTPPKPAPTLNRATLEEIRRELLEARTLLDGLLRTPSQG